MENQSSAFTEEPNLIVEEYRPIMPLAIISLVIGILSSITLLNIYLVVVPAIGALLGVVALVRLTVNRKRASGLWVASLGLMLSLFFGSWAVSQSASDNAVVYRQAREHAEFWFSLLKDGKIYQAYELRLAYPQRKMPGVDLAEVYKERGEGFFANAELAEEMGTTAQEMSLSKRGLNFSGFVSGEPFRRIYEHAQEGEFEFVRNLGMRQSGVNRRVAQLYRLSYKDERDEPQRIEFILEMERTFYPDDRVYHWNIAAVQPATAR